MALQLRSANYIFDNGNLDRCRSQIKRAIGRMSAKGQEQTMSEPSGTSALHPLSGHWS